MAEAVIFYMIPEMICNMTIHITTYDTRVYVDKSVDFVDYLRLFTEKTTDGSKMVYNSSKTIVDNKNKMVLNQSTAQIDRKIKDRKAW